MYLIYSAYQHQVSPNTADPNNHEKQLRYEAYMAVCEKYRREIAAIQKHLPNWKPRFEQ